MASNNTYKKLSDTIKRSGDSWQDAICTEHGEDVLRQITNSRPETWVTLVSDVIQEPCLDVSSGLGHRTKILAQAGFDVYGINSCKYQTEIARKNTEGLDNVTLINSSPNNIPFEENQFKSIFIPVDNPREIEKAANLLDKYLHEEGVAFVLVNGWVRKLGITNLFGLEENYKNIETPRSIPNLGMGSYGNKIKQEGFNNISKYCVLYNKTGLRTWSFDVDNTEVINWLLNSEDKANIPTRIKISQYLAKLLHKIGYLQYYFPKYVYVFDKQAEKYSDYSSSELLMTSMYRSVILDFDNGINKVRRTSTNSRGQDLNANAFQNIEKLRSLDTKISDTFPEGSTSYNKFGMQWQEDPVSGQTLNQLTTRDVEGFEKSIKIGLDWLEDLQNEYRGEKFTISSLNDLDEYNLEKYGSNINDILPRIEKKLTLFETPCHGDFSPPNIFIENDVERVIDWELSNLTSHPMIDAGYFILQLSEFIFQDFETGLKKVFLQDSEYHKVAKKYVKEYCRSVDLPIESFITLLPSNYMRRAKIDWENYGFLCVDWDDRVRTVYRNIDVLHNQFNTGR